MLSLIYRQARNFFLAQGIFAVLAGLAILVWPGQSFVIVAYIFAGWLIADGVFSCFLWLRARRVPGAQLSMGKGLIQIILGVIIAMLPGVFASIILVIVSLAVFLIGMGLLTTGLVIKPTGNRTWVAFVVCGVLAFAGSVMIVVFPRESTLALLTVVATVLIFVGATCLALGFKFGKSAQALADRERAYSNPSNDGRGDVIEGTVEDTGNDDTPPGISR
ncbi:hypothetical protein HMPREF0183_0826 [Brevibacterium mcbrellneri ATCC 49030]|uniref:Acid-resistance membrane protein n=1 Tax=Brevibacterium mcbrellneri ATCC 49030 TaxID=585530 RepID=D4YLL6_9MICO|nr:DUF308 domain-containing protein [Brevibacterium mcbrellneri]EFG47933.1 hypothetical protein HMPREF0183_0826 [Brevibacterium mcbrellneri ATCC 49030]